MRNHSAPKQRQKRHRCSEHSRRKTVTQSHGTNATYVAMSAGPPAQDWAPAAFSFLAAGAAIKKSISHAAQSKAVERRRRRATGLPRLSRHVRRAASATTLDAGGFFFRRLGDDVHTQAVGSTGVATECRPSRDPRDDVLQDRVSRSAL